MVEHIRETECGLREELEPIDENRRYDFNYQQFTILPKTRQIFPVSYYCQAQTPQLNSDVICDMLLANDLPCRVMKSNCSASMAHLETQE